MSMTVTDILGNADVFRRAYPSWPHAEPERATAPVVSLDAWRGFEDTDRLDCGHFPELCGCPGDSTTEGN
jgi:hypothetical protein